jgi:hypothetical protein
MGVAMAPARPLLSPSLMVFEETCMVDASPRCVGTSHAHLGLEVVSRWKPRSRLDRRDGGILDSVPLLGGSRSRAWWRSYVVLLRCLPLFKVGHRRRYARHTSLLGGVAEVCWYFSRSPFRLEVVSGRNPRSGLDERDGGILNIVPLLGASLSGAWWRSYVMLLWCLSLFKVGHRKRYARDSWRVQGDDFSRPTKFRHLVL